MFHEKSRLSSLLFFERASRIGKKEFEVPIGISHQLMSRKLKLLALSIRVHR